VNLHHIQINDLDEEAEEEAAATEQEELARVQQEIERLRQEQESIVRRKVAMQCAEARRQNINREQARLAEMQYNLYVLHHQGHEAPLPSPLHNQIHHQPPPQDLPQNHLFQPPLPPQKGNIDPKSPLAEHLQLAPWPLHYRVVPPPKYHGNTEPRKFLMCYEAAIASAGGDKATLVKSLIISLGDAAVNWNSGLRPRCINSWQHLQGKILLNFQGFQAELYTEEDFLACVQKERTIAKFLSEVPPTQSLGTRGV
jgi:hypothetical protein